MTQYAAKILSGALQVSTDVGNQIRIRLYADGQIADLTDVISAVLIVQFNDKPSDQRSFPLDLLDLATALVEYTPVVGDFAQPPADPMYPNVSGQVVLTFSSGVVASSTPFEMQVRALF